MCDETAMMALAAQVQQACLAAARRGYEEAAVSGLCHEGAWEAALGAIEMVDLDALVAGSKEGSL